MTTPQDKAAEALRLADELAALVDTYPQEDEDTPGGYCSVFDEQLDTAAVMLREYAALRQAQAKVEPVAWCEPSWLDPKLRNWPDESFRSHPVDGWIPLYANLRQAEAGRVPPGWKLVPVEPTIAMCIAGDGARMNVDDMTRTPAIYRAMLAAALQPPKEQP